MAITFDPTKNYAEFGNAFFRGRLKGASGEARFKLVADTINAVSTVNIAKQAVTFSFYAKYVNVVGTTYCTLPIDVPDDGEIWLEFICYGENATQFYFDGVLRGTFNQRRLNSKTNPYNELIRVTKGAHTAILKGTVGSSSEGYIFCRYIRKTGSEAIS